MLWWGVSGVSHVVFTQSHDITEVYKFIDTVDDGTYAIWDVLQKLYESFKK